MNLKLTLVKSKYLRMIFIARVSKIFFLFQVRNRYRVQEVSIWYFAAKRSVFPFHIWLTEIHLVRSFFMTSIFMTSLVFDPFFLFEKPIFANLWRTVIPRVFLHMGDVVKVALVVISAVFCGNFIRLRFASNIGSILTQIQADFRI